MTPVVVSVEALKQAGTFTDTTPFGESKSFTCICGELLRKSRKNMLIKHAPCPQCGCVEWYSTYMSEDTGFWGDGKGVSYTFCQDCHRGYRTKKWMVWQMTKMIEVEHARR